MSPCRALSAFGRTERQRVVKLVRRPCHQAVAYAVYALVAEEGVVGSDANGGHVLFQVCGAPGGEEGLGGAVERSGLALVAREREGRRAELFIGRAPQIVRRLVAVFAGVDLGLLQEPDGILRAVTLDVIDQEPSRLSANRRSPEPGYSWAFRTRLPECRTPAVRVAARYLPQGRRPVHRIPERDDCDSARSPSS